MKYNNKKGQAAMEFLMTYGWAILAAIVVIAVLAIYFRPSSIVSNTAVVSAPFYVNAFTMTPNAGGQANDDNITIEIRNNGGEDLSSVSVNITLTQPAGINCAASTPVNLTAGSIVSHAVRCTGIASGNAISGTITISYGRPGSSLTLTSTGSITGKVA